MLVGGAAGGDVDDGHGGCCYYLLAYDGDHRWCHLFLFLAQESSRRNNDRELRWYFHLPCLDQRVGHVSPVDDSVAAGDGAAAAVAQVVVAVGCGGGDADAFPDVVATVDCADDGGAVGVDADGGDAMLQFPAAIVGQGNRGIVAGRPSPKLVHL